MKKKEEDREVKVIESGSGITVKNVVLYFLAPKFQISGTGSTGKFIFFYFNY